MPKSCLLLFLVAMYNTGFSQLPEERLKAWATNNPIEKIYVQPDREDYVAGQTLWFKAYLNNGFQANADATVIFVELLDNGSRVIVKAALPVVNGVTQGQLDLGDSLVTGNYFLRAYTATMMNQPGFLFHRPISITGKPARTLTTGATEKKLRIEFFPEGGNFVSGKPNTLAFKATREDGFPVSIKGFIKNNRGIQVPFSTYHDGMGLIDLEVRHGENYFAVIDDRPDDTYPLPPVSEKGIVFRILPADDAVRFEIFQDKNDPLFHAAYMLGQVQHQVVIRQELKAASNTLNGVIKTQNLPSGILHLTIFNKDHIPLAQRLVFVNNREYQQRAQIKFDSLNFSNRGRNKLSITMPDTVRGSFSLSITDAAFNINQYQEENIVTRFLLTSDLPGYIHQPTYYFRNNTDSARYALDLVMMTNGWRRFLWQELKENKALPAKYKDPAFITVSGKINMEGSKKPFANKDVLLYVLTADSSRNMQLIHTDSNGYYKLDSMVFFDRASLFITDIRGKKSRFIDIKPGPDSLMRPYFAGSMDVMGVGPLLVRSDLPRSRFETEFDRLSQAEGKVLSEVVLKSRKKSAIEILDEKYARGVFSGETRKTFDLVNTDEANSYTNIFDFLQTKVIGLDVSRSEDGDWFVYYRQMASAFGNPPMTLFLDEVLTDANTIAFLNPREVAMIKLYTQFVGAEGNAPGGALAVYLKKGEDLARVMPERGEVIYYQGFSVIKEFYSPDYSQPQQKFIPDNRMTLFWKPDIQINSVNPTIPISFYNNDRSRSFKITLEGMTTEGKMVSMEQVIK